MIDNGLTQSIIAVIIRYVPLHYHHHHYYYCCGQWTDASDRSIRLNIMVARHAIISVVVEQRSRAGAGAGGAGERTVSAKVRTVGGPILLLHYYYYYPRS